MINYSELTFEGYSKGIRDKASQYTYQDQKEQGDILRSECASASCTLQHAPTSHVASAFHLYPRILGCKKRRRPRTRWNTMLELTSSLAQPPHAHGFTVIFSSKRSAFPLWLIRALYEPRKVLDQRQEPIRDFLELWECFDRQL
jgi:hypothetical protein